MSVRPRSRIVGVSALAFVVVLGGLTALRAWNLEPPTAVQSLVVDAGAVLVVAGVAAHVARGENIGTRAGEGIVLAFGPCLGFAANLFVPVSTVESPLWVAYPLVAGAALALAVGGVGAAVGYVVRVVRKNGTAIGRTS
ncbi:hypothetical protein [Haloferax volcanii]|uniref:Uncharacterized protein n=1 Tax=Haloferax volcanii TaxID=2246 RepID=A0A558GEQ1_HALVO|nr:MULTISPECIES: hypothetical protein [Haloferax]NLV02470.1 hypothetical protein [Haloferax alexandrinus]TVT96247.1 hypothetical protein FQA18_02025 [Haloferax volcanii]